MASGRAGAFQEGVDGPDEPGHDGLRETVPEPAGRSVPKGPWAPVFPAFAGTGAGVTLKGWNRGAGAPDTELMATWIGSRQQVPG